MLEIPHGEEESSTSVEDLFVSIASDGKINGNDKEDFNSLETEYTTLKGKLIQKTSNELKFSLEKMLFYGYSIENENDYHVLESICKISGINWGILPPYDVYNSQYLDNGDFPHSVRLWWNGVLNIFGTNETLIFDIQWENIVYNSEDIILPLWTKDGLSNNNNAEHLYDLLESKKIINVLFPEYKVLEGQKIAEAQKFNQQKYDDIETQAILNILGSPSDTFDNESIEYITDYQSYVWLDIDWKIGTNTLNLMIWDYIEAHGDIVTINGLDYIIYCEDWQLFCEEKVLSKREEVTKLLEREFNFKVWITESRTSFDIDVWDEESLWKLWYSFSRKFSWAVKQEIFWKKTTKWEGRNHNSYSVIYKVNDTYEELKFRARKKGENWYIDSSFLRKENSDWWSENRLVFWTGKSNLSWWRLDWTFWLHQYEWNNLEDKNKITGSLIWKIKIPGDRNFTLWYKVTAQDEFTIISIDGKRKNGGNYELWLDTSGKPYLHIWWTRHLFLDAVLPDVLRNDNGYLNYEFQISPDKVGLKIKIAVGASWRK